MMVTSTGTTTSTTTTTTSVTSKLLQSPPPKSQQEAQGNDNKVDTILLMENTNVTTTASTVRGTTTTSSTTHESSDGVVVVEATRPTTTTTTPTTTLTTTSTDSTSLSSKTSTNNNNTIVLSSYVFGKAAMEKQYLRLFVESSKTSGVDIVLIGDVVPSFPLPSHVRHVLLSWSDFISHVESVLQINLSQTKHASPYKVIDFKPLFAVLFPDIVQPYTFWGHTDNDMLLGNLQQILTTEFLDSVDVTSRLMKDESSPHFGGMVTHGPLTLYRNTPLLNTLFSVHVDMAYIFNTTEPRFFDEFGQHQRKAPYRYSMSHILNQHGQRLGIRRKPFPTGMQWDGNCVTRKNKEIRTDVDQNTCFFCVYDHGTVKTGPNLQEYPMFCHFEKFKQVVEASLHKNNTSTNNNYGTTVVEELIQSGRFRVDQQHGYTPWSPTSEPEQN
jgi:hypothetical protein